MEIPQNYHRHPLKNSLIVNDLEFDEIIISPHYEEKHISYMNDKKILEIIRFLDNKIFPIYRSGEKEGRNWNSFFYEPIFYEDKPYRLVWYWEKGKKWLLIIHCHRVSKEKYER